MCNHGVIYCFWDCYRNTDGNVDETVDSIVTCWWVNWFSY